MKNQLFKNPPKEFIVLLKLYGLHDVDVIEVY